MSTMVQVTVKVSPRVVKQSDGLIPLLSDEMGHDASRADVLRRAIAIGLKVLTQRRRDGGGPEGDEVDEDVGAAAE